MRLDNSFNLRPATESDFPEIKALIRQVRINPTRLDWHQFTVAVLGGDMIGCIQLKAVPRDLMELASLAVKPAFRHQGVARALIEHVLANSSRPLYLTCRSGLGTMYTKFGFQVVGEDDMPRYYIRLQRLVNKLMKMKYREETLLVMKLG